MTYDVITEHFDPLTIMKAVSDKQNDRGLHFHSYLFADNELYQGQNSLERVRW